MHFQLDTHIGVCNTCELGFALAPKPLSLPNPHPWASKHKPRTSIFEYPHTNERVSFNESAQHVLKHLNLGREDTECKNTTNALMSTGQSKRFETYCCLKQKTSASTTKRTRLFLAGLINVCWNTLAAAAKTGSASKWTRLFLAGKIKTYLTGQIKTCWNALFV